MIKVVIFGQPGKWKKAIEMVAKYRPDVMVYALSNYDLAEVEYSEVVITPEEMADLYRSGVIDGVIQINGENPYYFMLLEQLGITDVYVIPEVLYYRSAQGMEISGQEVIALYRDVLPELWQIEVQLADHCNLNCKGCTHFSSLVREPVFADKEQFARDVSQLKKYFSYLHNFYLMGGEPLLNPELCDYIDIVRDNFPYTKIIITTNGLLLLTLKASVLRRIKDCGAQISISDYSCIDRQKIIDFLGEYGIVPEIRGGKEDFGKHMNLKGDSDPAETFYHCPSKFCTFLGKGKIAACCQPLTVHYFNSYFGEQIIEDEGIGLYEPGLDGHAVAKRLFTPMESCRYCTKDVSFEWEAGKDPFDKNDWCVS